MKCQIFFSGKNKKNIISLSSTEFAQRVVKFKDEKSVCSTIISILYACLRIWKTNYKAMMEITCSVNVCHSH